MTVFRQTLVHEGPDALVTYLPRAGVRQPTVVDGRTVLEEASPIVWFTFPGARHDVGRFHTPGGAFTGFYANILTPVRVDPGPTDRWETTDLFLDVFLPPGGRPRVLDRDELEEAVREGWLAEESARRAGEEAERLVRLAGEGRWPPVVCREWTLERARSVLDAAAP